MRVKPWPFINLRKEKVKSWAWGFAFGLAIGHFVTLYILLSGDLR